MRILFVCQPCKSGECVPYYQCAKGIIIDDGEGLLDIRLGEENGQTEQHPCTGLFETCCTLRMEPKIPDVKINEVCGVRNTDGVGFRITGNNDHEAQFGMRYLNSKSYCVINLYCLFLI